MAVKIRMRRTGANKDISYRVVVTDERSPRDGKFIEIVGWYDPKQKGVNFSLKQDRIEFWHNRGAIISQPVQSLLRRNRRAVAAAAKA